PVVPARLVQKVLDVSQPTASALVARLCHFGILQETTGRQRNRSYAFAPTSSSSPGPIAAVKACDELRLQSGHRGLDPERSPLPHRQHAPPLEQNVRVSPSLESAFSAAHLRRLAGSRSFDRGHAYADSGRVKRVEIGNQEARAAVLGSREYSVR